MAHFRVPSDNMQKGAHFCTYAFLCNEFVVGSDFYGKYSLTSDYQRRFPFKTEVVRSLVSLIDKR